MAEVPEQIGKYKIMSVVAVGGMGTVYKAVHPSLKRQVIIKKLTLKGGSASIKERFKREAQILLDLSSPYIVRMFDYFTEGKADYIVLEFVNGMSLDVLIEKQTCLPPQLALLIFLDACYGLKHAHAKNIVHRDIKPGNILISRLGEVKLADFGIASAEKEDMTSPHALTRIDSHAQKVGITQFGATLGTPAYMSPEQLVDSSSVDQRADIYSMGVMLYEMVTGTKPYLGDMSEESINRIKKGKYIPPEKIDKTLPLIVRRLIKKMMKVNPSKRYQSIDPVIGKIRRYLKKYDTHALRVSMVQAMLAPKSITFPEFVPKKHLAVKVSLGIFGALVLSGLIVFAWMQGFFHATILRRIYTPVTLSLELPATASADADLPARAFFFENDNGEIPEINNSRRNFLPVKVEDADSSSKASVKYKTKPVYLKPGEYRIKVVEGPFVWWKNISVTHENAEISLEFLKNASRQIKLHVTATDRADGRDITSSTTFLISMNGEWVDLKTVNPSKFKTGTVYRIRVVSNGYVEEYYSLRIDWYQDELFINSSLQKK